MSQASQQMTALARKHRRILVIRPDRIGDVTLATPVFRALRQTFPDANLAALVRPATEPVLRHNPHIDAILVDDWEQSHAGRAGFADRLRMLRRHRFDTALMLLPTERHAWMTFLAGIRTRIGVGTKLYQILTCARSVSRQKYIPLRHEADYCLDLARAIGVRSDDLRTEAFLTDVERSAAQERLRLIGQVPGRPLISIHPESGRSAPNWTTDVYRQFAEGLLTHIPEAQVLINVTPGNSAARASFEPLRSRGMLLPDGSTDLRLLMGLIAEADVVVSASTGPMHLAAALGTPTVSLFCPLTACSPILWGPQGNRSNTILPPDDYCQTRCPGDPHICTFEGGITPVQVIAAVRDMLRL
ncbi:MAG: glycosyltransferase family 9 protein [Bacteroidetes bacterium]|nr:glycosyltransferase family 9 protein [Bacteroidota bacterium]